jgi:hypothetical protein
VGRGGREWWRARTFLMGRDERASRDGEARDPGARSVVNRGVDAGIGTRKGEISPSDAAPRGFDRLRTPISRPGIAPREGKTTRVPDRTAVLTP